MELGGQGADQQDTKPIKAKSPIKGFLLSGTLGYFSPAETELPRRLLDTAFTAPYIST